MSKDDEKGWITEEKIRRVQALVDSFGYKPPEGMSKEMQSWLAEAVNDLMGGEMREELEMYEIEAFAIKVWKKAREK